MSAPLQVFTDAKALIAAKETVGGYTNNQLADVITAYNNAYNNGSNCLDETATTTTALQTAINNLKNTYTPITEEDKATLEKAANCLNNANTVDNYTTSQLANLKTAYGDGSFDNLAAVKTALTALESQAKITTEQYNARTEAAGYLGSADAVGSYTTAELAALKTVWDADNSFDNITAIMSALSTLKNTYTPIAFDKTKTYNLYNSFRGGYAMYDANNATYTSSNIAAGTTTVDATTLATDAYLWEVYQYQGKTYLFNKGAGKFIENSSSSNWPFTATPIPMTFNQYNDGNYVYYNLKMESRTGTYIYFNMGKSTDISTTNRQLASWSASPSTISSGSSWIIRPTTVAADYTPIVKALSQQIVDSYDATKVDYVGMPSTTTVDNLKTLIANSSTTADQYEAGMDAATKSESSLLTSDNLFRIESAFTFTDGGTKALYESEDGTNVAWKTENATMVPMLWRLVANADGTYRIQSANSKKEIGTFSYTTSPTMVATGSGCSLGLNNCSFLNYAFQGTNGGDVVTLALYNTSKVATKADANGILRSYNSISDTYPTLFMLHKASSIDVAVSAAGYATLWLPFAVTVPTGVTVSGITQTSASTATLTDLAGNTLKAETPVVLKAAEGTYTFPFTSETGASIDGNLLTGTSTPTAVADDASYVLALTSANKPGFCIAGPLTIPVNKAYLLKTSLSESSKSYKELNFGGTTGIQSITTSDEKAPVYFDLAGRRVINPSHGVYIKNGKKVVIK